MSLRKKWCAPLRSWQSIVLRSWPLRDRPSLRTGWDGEIWRFPWRHGASPKNGWLMSWKIPSRNGWWMMMVWGVPPFQEPPPYIYGGVVWVGSLLDFRGKSMRIPYSYGCFNRETTDTRAGFSVATFDCRMRRWIYITQSNQKWIISATLTPDTHNLKHNSLLHSCFRPLSASKWRFPEIGVPPNHPWDFPL